MSEAMRGQSSQRTSTKSEDSLSVQERQALEAYGLSTDAYNSPQQEAVDYVQIWTTHVESVAEPELIVAMNQFYNECVDGDYYNWLNDTYYEGQMPEIVRRANAFRGFPQLDEELNNPEGWEQKHAYYQSPKGIRDMEPYQAFIKRERRRYSILNSVNTADWRRRRSRKRGPIRRVSPTSPRVPPRGQEVQRRRPQRQRSCWPTPSPGAIANPLMVLAEAAEMCRSTAAQGGRGG